MNQQGKKVTSKKDILGRIQVNGKKSTSADSKPNFENNATGRLINPAKNEIGRDLSSKTSIKYYEMNCSNGIIQQQLSTGFTKLKNKTNITVRTDKKRRFSII